MQIGDYELTHRLGAGGMGTVFRAVDSSSRPVALKFIGSQTEINETVFGKLSPGDSPALDLRYRMMLVREASIAMWLNHPNIVRVFDYDQHQGLLYIVMELLGGRSLDKAIPLQAAIPLTTKISLMRQLCAALKYAHSQNVIHRDIKPSNCRVLPDGKLKVLDFGIAARPNDGAGDLKLVGTFPYMAPEILNPLPQYSEKSDLWATGVTFYQLLTGSLPFTGSSFVELRNTILQEDFPPLSDQLPNREALTAILTRALAKNPADRYRNAAEFGYQLSLVGDPVPTRNAAPGNAPRAGEDRWWATNVVKGTAITSPLTQSTEGKISPVSGEVKSCSGGHTTRFADYNHSLYPIVAGWSLLVVGYAMMKIRGWEFDLPYNGFSRNGFTSFVLEHLAYLGGFLIPLLVGGSIVLGALAFWENFAGTTRCRRCREILRHESRTTAFAFSETSCRHASSDCLAALKENLWNDAPRLLSIHGDPPPGDGGNPPLGKKTDHSQKTQHSQLTQLNLHRDQNVHLDLNLRLDPKLPQLRLHLDMYSCKACGDELAILTTEERLEKVWEARPEYEGMWKSSGMPPIKRGFTRRLARVLQALSRAVHPGAVRIFPLVGGFALAVSFLMVAFYYPQIPVLAGVPGYRSVVIIDTDPPGVGINVDDVRYVAPHTFSWSAGTLHNIDFALGLRKKGQLYVFGRLVPADAFTIHDKPAHYASFKIQAQAGLDGWGRLTRPSPRTFRIVYLGR